MRRFTVSIASILLTVIVASALGWAYFTNMSPDRSRYPVRGIDVSHHQGAIDWRTVARDDVSFAVIKATEGGDHVDEDFAANLRAARAEGIAVGAYHYFTLCRPGAEQAANFLATVPTDGPILPPAVDLEYEGNCSARPTPQALRAELDAFLAPVEAAFGRPAILYVTSGFSQDYVSHLPDRGRWERSIAWHPSRENWILWQYQDSGRVEGIKGDVDLNVFQGDRDAFARFLASG